jgi:hypothetical protein
MFYQSESVLKIKSHAEQELLTIPEHQRITPGFYIPEHQRVTPAFTFRSTSG